MSLRRSVGAALVGSALALLIAPIPVAATATTTSTPPTTSTPTSTSAVEVCPDDSGSGAADESDSPEPVQQLVGDAEVEARLREYPEPGTPDAQAAASDLFAQGSALVGVDRKAAAELRWRVALVLDPDRADIEAAIASLYAAPAPAADTTFQDALELLRCPDAEVALEGVELAIAVAKSKSVPLSATVASEYPPDQRPYLPADRLLAAGRDDDARTLAAFIAAEQPHGTPAATVPDRLRQNWWERWVEGAAVAILEGAATLTGFLAAVGFAAWALLQLVKKAWRHRWWHREVQVALGDFSDGSEIKGAVAAAKAVVTRELQFAAGQSSSLDAITGAGAAMTTVELPSQLKVLGPLLDWARRGPRYSLVVHIHRESATMLGVLGEVHTTTGRVIAAESFREPIAADKGIEAVDRVSIDLASWAAFEVSRLRRWPRIRKGLDKAPRLLGTERWSSYALYRRAMQGDEPDKKLLEQAIDISPDNFAALLQLGTIQLRTAVPDRGQHSDVDDLYADAILPALRRLAKGLELVERYPTVELWPARWFRKRMVELGPYAKGLAESQPPGNRSKIGWPAPRYGLLHVFSEHPGLLLCMYGQVDPMWYHATFRLAVGHFHAASLLSSAGRSGEVAREHLATSAELSVALAKAVGATQYSLVGQFGSRPASAVALRDYGTRRALVELTQRDGAYFASILAGILAAAEQAGICINHPEAGEQHESVPADTERLLERLGSSRHWLAVGQLRSEIEPYKDRDYRIAYNSAVNLAQELALPQDRPERDAAADALAQEPADPVSESQIALELAAAFDGMPLPVLRQRLPWFKKDPSLWRAWAADEEAMQALFESVEQRLATKTPKKQPKWVDA